jgi:hypothetical protein
MDQPHRGSSSSSSPYSAGMEHVDQLFRISSGVDPGPKTTQNKPQITGQIKVLSRQVAVLLLVAAG